MKRSNMKRGGPIKRKRRLRAKSLKNSKPGTPMKRCGNLLARSKTNSRKHENLKLRAEYMEANPECELAQLFPKIIAPGYRGYYRRWRHSVPGRGNEIQLVADVEPSQDPHHIVSGKIGGTKRWDLVTNLAAVCRPVHEFCEAYGAEGIILCLWVKVLKSEYDGEALSRVTHVQFPDYLETLNPKFDFVKDIHAKLLERLCR